MQVPTSLYSAIGRTDCVTPAVFLWLYLNTANIWNRYYQDSLPSHPLAVTQKTKRHAMQSKPSCIPYNGSKKTIH